MDYVIIRPGGLKSEPGTGKGVLTEDTKGEPLEPLALASI